MSRAARRGLMVLVMVSLDGCLVTPETHQDKRQGAADEVATDDSAGGAQGDDSGDTGEDEGVPPLEEMRGIWITRWSWDSPDEIDAMFADVAASGFNAVFFQVRGSFDAYYRSGVEPWAERLTGTLGQDPGWDPLQTAIDAGEAQGLQVHAYVNTFPLWSGTEAPTASSPEHAYSAHPTWLVADGEGIPMALNSSYVFASPGNPSVRAHIAAVVADIVRNYAVDGVHLDYVRYSDHGYSHDATSEARWAELGGDLAWEDWQREQINLTVERVSDAVDVPVTAAVWGIHTNEWGWSGVSQGSRDYYQDSRAFLEEGLLDANIPMIYWPVSEVEGDRLDFRSLVRDHVSHANGRHVYAGMGGSNIDYDQLVACIEASRDEGAQGVVVFDYTLFGADLIRLREGVFAEDAVPPSMPWR
jgi:uncharacterized lipoprotein YddW (UPF0748 family)